MTASPSDEALRRILADGRRRAEHASAEHVRLWGALEAATDGGKRFRPVLVQVAHDALGGTRPAAAAEVGAAIELLHTAFLIHDDVIDEDEVRRGRLNVSGTFRRDALAAGADPRDAESLGRAAAILAGDLALAAAVRVTASCGAPAAVVRQLLDLVDSALHITSAGELDDVRLAAGTAGPSLDASLRMAEQKTSAYSFALPLQAGAVLADADPSVVPRLEVAGRAMGLAFQLADDLVGVFGDPAVSGKSATSDLRTGKHTPLLAHASGTSEWPRLRAHLGRDLSGPELDTARRLLTRAGSRRFVEDLVEDHLGRARTILEDLGLPGDLATAVRPGPGVLVPHDGAAA